MQSCRTRIDGKDAENSELAVVRSPFDGRPIAEVGVANKSHIEAAIASAERGPQRLRRSPTHERAQLLGRISAAIAARADEFAELISDESGSQSATHAQK
jgi:acyl-CoA reductase-like NAD-dependent aldehyde dehydrogenase